MAKRLGLPLLALLAVCGFAVRAADSEIEQLKKMIQAQNAKIEKLEKAQGASVATSQVDKAVASKGACYLAPDKPAIKGTGLTFTGEFLYWKPVTSDLDYAITHDDMDDDNFPALYGNGGNQAVKMGWAPGFRLGLGYRLPYEGWDVKAAYTYFRSEGDASVSDGDGFIVGNLLNEYADELDFELAKAKTNFDLDVVDFDVGRNTRISESLSLRPFIGFRYAKIKAAVDAKYYDDAASADNYYFAKVSSSSDLFGIHFGSDVELKIKHGFSFYGQFAGSILSGSVDSKYNDGSVVALALDETYDNMKWSKNVIVPAVQVAAGVSWEKKLLDNLNLKISAGYEYNEFFNALDLTKGRYGYDYWGQPNHAPQDLGLHGLVFRIKLDF
jgi:hypothetical protein